VSFYVLGIVFFLDFLFIFNLDISKSSKNT
jgi:hypothetical protein